MRKYAAFYDGVTWKVIFQDDGEEEWYVEIPDAGTMANASLIAKLLTEVESTD